ncbi:MAG: hypothetical protein O3C15_07055 [Proteobacteria bacterium]|nr:hypothetical protein [Pseudomonadota bacterium]
MSHLNTFENLDDLLDAAVLENLCCRRGCTTCGASFFRQKVADFLAFKMRKPRHRVSGNFGDHELSPDQVQVLAEELRKVTEGLVVRFRMRARRVRSEAIDFLIQEVWDFAPRTTREEWMRNVLGGSIAGQRFEQMLAHYNEMLRRRAIYDEQNSPAGIALRKAEKARLRDERLEERAIRKAEIDRLWKERGSK